MPNDIAMQSATELLKLYRSKQLSPVEVTKAALAQISMHDPQLNAFCYVDEDAALAAAGESESRWQKGAPKGLLDGVPTAIKDVILTKGWPTLRGSRIVSKDQTWNEDAPCTARLARAWCHTARKDHHSRVRLEGGHR